MDKEGKETNSSARVQGEDNQGAQSASVPQHEPPLQRSVLSTINVQDLTALGLQPSAGLQDGLNLGSAAHGDSATVDANLPVPPAVVSVRGPGSTANVRAPGGDAVESAASDEVPATDGTAADVLEAGNEGNVENVPVPANKPLPRYSIDILFY